MSSEHENDNKVGSESDSSSNKDLSLSSDREHSGSVVECLTLD